MRSQAPGSSRKSDRKRSQKVNARSKSGQESAGQSLINSISTRHPVSDGEIVPRHAVRISQGEAMPPGLTPCWAQPS